MSTELDVDAIRARAKRIAAKYAVSNCLMTAAEEDRAALLAALDAVTAERDVLKAALVQIRKWGSPFDAHGTHAARVRVLVESALSAVPSVEETRP